MKFRYITIEREYGSGGTKIARRLSEACGVPCYGHEILEAVAKKQGIPVERINQYEEKATGSVLYTMFVMSRVQTGNPDMLTAEPCTDRESGYADGRRKSFPRRAA